MEAKHLEIYLREIEKKNSWGKNELKFLILDIISGKIK